MINNRGFYINVNSYDKIELWNKLDKNIIRLNMDRNQIIEEDSKQIVIENWEKEIKLFEQECELDIKLISRQSFEDWREQIIPFDLFKINIIISFKNKFLRRPPVFTISRLGYLEMVISDEHMKIIIEFYKKHFPCSINSIKLHFNTSNERGCKKFIKSLWNVAGRISSNATLSKLKMDNWIFSLLINSFSHIQTLSLMNWTFHHLEEIVNVNPHT